MKNSLNLDLQDYMMNKIHPANLLIMKILVQDNNSEQGTKEYKEKIIQNHNNQINQSSDK